MSQLTTPPPPKKMYVGIYVHYNRPKQDFADRCAEESVGEEKLILRVARLGRDAQVKEAYPSLQLAGEVHGLRGQPLPH